MLITYYYYCNPRSITYFMRLTELEHDCITDVISLHPNGSVCIYEWGTKLSKKIIDSWKADTVWEVINEQLFNRMLLEVLNGN